MKGRKRWFLFAFTLMLGIGGFLLGPSATMPVEATVPPPGSEADPLVAKSYVDQQLRLFTEQFEKEITVLRMMLESAEPANGNSHTLEETKRYIDEQIALLRTETAPPLVVVDLRAGQMLTAEAGTELIVRAGQMAAITSPLGGLSDVTSGVDRQHGEQVPANHLLLVPRSDGRGLLALTDGIVLVRGAYTVR